MIKVETSGLCSPGGGRAGLTGDDTLDIGPVADQDGGHSTDGKGCARGRVRSRRRESGCRYVAATGGTVGAALTARTDLTAGLPDRGRDLRVHGRRERPVHRRRAVDRAGQPGRPNSRRRLRPLRRGQLCGERLEGRLDREVCTAWVPEPAPVSWTLLAARNVIAGQSAPGRPAGTAPACRTGRGTGTRPESTGKPPRPRYR